MHQTTGQAGSDHERWYGRLTVDPPGPITAGSWGTWRLIYTVGRYGMDNGSRLRLLFRYPWDGGTPQATDPQADDYVTATASNPAARVTIRFDPKGGRRPWLPALIFEIKDEALGEGEQVFITIGDTRGGSRGHRVQTYVESQFRWLMDVECFETGTWVELESSPCCPVIAAEPDRLVLVAPSAPVAGEPFHVHVRCTDRFGNPAPAYRGTVRLAAERLDGTPVPGWAGPACTFTAADGGTRRLEGLTLPEPGQYRLVVTEAGSQRRAVSNPIQVLGAAPALRLYWGDLHAQYNNALGIGSVKEAMQYARDVAGIDFAGHQPNDFQFRQEGWDEVRRDLPPFHVPHRFVPFVGYEWSGNTPAGGDRNVHFLSDDGPLHRSSHWHVPDRSDAHMDRYPLGELYQAFRGRRDVLMVPHVGGRRCDLTRYHDPELEPVVEICSCHGRFEWLLHEAIANGYTVGVIGGSDDHTGRPGAAYATSHSFGVRGGLAAVYAAELTRAGLFAALRARHCYATTGERIWLEVTTADGHMMGDAWASGRPPEIRVQAAGTRPLERVEIVRNLDTVYRLPLFTASDFTPARVRIEWGGARVKGRGRHATWHGGLQVTGGRILQAEGVAFDHPHQGITAWDATSVQWSSTTSGDHDAVILTLDGPDATIAVRTPLADLTCRAADLTAGPLRRECGGVGCYLEARLEPVRPGPLAVRFAWTDPEPQPGRNAYWVRLVQADGEMAWSSPLYWTWQ